MIPDYHITEGSPSINNLMRELNGLNMRKMWVISIRERKKNKSRQQEKYFHKLVDIICKFNGDDKRDMKRQITWSCGLRDEFTTEDGEVIEFPRSTAGLELKDYSKIIDAAKHICMTLGLQYPEPSYYGYEL